MNLPESHIIRHIASVAKLSEAWCRRAMVRICHDDVAEVVKDEVNKLERSYETRNKNRPTPDTKPFDLMKVQRETAQQGHHLFATKIVRPLIFESISLRCWKSLVAAGRKDGLCGSDFETSSADYLAWAKRTRRDSSDRAVQNLWVQREIAKLLGVDSTNIGRWEKSLTVPDGNKVLAGVVLVFQQELKGFPYPNRPTVVRSMIRRTLSKVKNIQHKLNRSSPAIQLIGNDELHAVKVFHRLEFENSSVGPDEINKDMLKKQMVLLEKELRRKYPNSRLTGAVELRKALGDWATSFAMLQLALASGWPDGTESDWNWADITDE